MVLEAEMPKIEVLKDSVSIEASVFASNMVLWCCAPRKLYSHRHKIKKAEARQHSGLFLMKMSFYS
jgi:hypothetical protein